MTRIYEDQAIPLRVPAEPDAETRIEAAQKRRGEARERARKMNARIENAVRAHAAPKSADLNADPPGRFAQMRRLAFALPPEERSRTSVFYAQACFMEDFELDEAGAGGRNDDAFCCPTPTYAEMTNLQLRTYFRWRTRMRRGERAKPPSPSYGFVYAYELIHLIGFRKEPRKAFKELIALKQLLESAREEFSIFLGSWIRDFAVYYGMPPESIPEDSLPPPEPETPERIVMDASRPDAERAAGFKALSASPLEKLKSLNADPPLFDDALARIIRALSEKRLRDSCGARSFLSALLGQVPPRLWRPFGFALFFEREPHEAVRYELPNGRVYSCIAGRWQTEALDFDRRRNQRIALILKRLDRLLSLSLFGKAGRVGREEFAEPLESILKSAAADALKAKRERLNPAGSIDFEKLEGIRSDAAATQARLIAESDEEQREEEEPFGARGMPAADAAAASESRKQTSADGREAFEGGSRQTAGSLPETVQNDACGLLGEERRLLAALLNREGFDAVRDALGRLKLTTARAVDSINEKLLAQVGDAVLEAADGLPVLIEDYEEDVRELLANQK